MGTFSSWSYTAQCTVWEPVFDEFDEPSSYTATVYSCSYKAGTGLMLTSDGERFQPRNIVFLETLTPPAVGSYLSIGSIGSSTPPSDAQVIRSVREHDPSLFEGTLPDVVVMTQ